jgi:hypothetical protein
MSGQKAKLEAQYQAKQQAQTSEVSDLKQQLELKGTEIRSLNSTVENLKGVNEELKVESMVMSWVWVNLSERLHSEHLPSRPLVSRVGRTLRRVQRISSEHARRSLSNSPNLMV